jgi:hypothetical protein
MKSTMRRSTIFAFFVLACAACSTEATSASLEPGSSDSASTTARWQPVYRCEDGSVLDVNIDERREVQFVVRNEDAIGWMHHSIECHWSAANCPTNSRGEMVFRGRVDHGVHEPRDFDKVLARLTPASPEWSVAGLFDVEGDTIKLQIGEYYNWIFRGCR